MMTTTTTTTTTRVGKKKAEERHRYVFLLHTKTNSIVSYRIFLPYVRYYPMLENAKMIVSRPKENMRRTQVQPIG
jgi:hypothetical protein